MTDVYALMITNLQQSATEQRRRVLAGDVPRRAEPVRRLTRRRTRPASWPRHGSGAGRAAFSAIDTEGEQP